MPWMNVVVPLDGGDPDLGRLEIARCLAQPLEARITGVYAAALPAGALTWMTLDGWGAFELSHGSLTRTASAGETAARRQFDAFEYPWKSFAVSETEHWEGLRLVSRLAEVVVFGADAARGAGYLATAFQQILMDERRPIFVARSPVDPRAPVTLAWDGGREASRAARRAMPWLQKAQEVVVLTAPKATPREFDPARIVDYLSARKVKARLMPLSSAGEAGPQLLEAAARLGSDLMVAGAFGHPRFQRFIFGGTTHVLLHDRSGPSLFLSH